MMFLENTKACNVCLVVNTVSHCKDLWEMFFGQIDIHYPNNKIYVFTDDEVGLPVNVTPIRYDPKDNFRTQYLSCIRRVKEDFVIYLNEDYILYDDVNVELMNEYVELMRSDLEISFIKTNKSVNSTQRKYRGRENLMYLSPNREYFFSQNAALWRRKDLERVHEAGPDLHIGDLRTTLQFEVEANQVCRDLKLQGLYMYHGEPKRGKYHYDSNVFPYIATAIIKGKWNLREYFKELSPLLTKYGINPDVRGSNR